MFRKTSIIGLLAALTILVGIFIIVKYTGNDDRTFRSKVLEFDPEAITAIHIQDFQRGDETEIKKDGDEWILTGNGKEYNGGIDAIANAIGLLNKLNTESIVATKPGKWENYDVNDEKAIRVRLYSGDELAGDIYIGKFNFEQMPATTPGRQPQTKMTSYVRPAEEDKVYAVQGILRSNFQGGAKPFRDRRVFHCEDHYDITRVSIEGPGMQYEIIQTDTAEWTIDGVVADSAKADRYFRSLAYLRNYTFIDDVDVSSMTPQYTAVVEGRTCGPVTLKAYPAADSTVGYYITSTANEGTVFDGMKSKTFEKIFAEKESFFAE